MTIHSQLRCRYIAQLIGIARKQETWYIVSELVNGPDLQKLIFNLRYRADYDALCKEKLAGDMCRAVAYIHSQASVIHQDIKPGNFVVDLSYPGGLVKLIDLGISRLRTLEVPVFKNLILYS